MKAYKSSKKPPLIASEAAVAYALSPLKLVSGSVGLGVIRTARAGIKTGYFLELGARMGFSMQELATVLNVSLRTLQRYDADQVLDADQSAKVISLELLNGHGIEVFGDQHSFNEWLRIPVAELDDKSPLSYLDTPFGFMVLEQILGRIEHGIFA